MQINKPYKETSKRTVENKSEIKSNPFLQPKHSNKLTQSIQNIQHMADFWYYNIIFSYEIFFGVLIS